MVLGILQVWGSPKLFSGSFHPEMQRSLSIAENSYAKHGRNPDPARILQHTHTHTHTHKQKILKSPWRILRALRVLVENLKDFESFDRTTTIWKILENPWESRESWQLFLLLSMLCSLWWFETKRIPTETNKYSERAPRRMKESPQNIRDEMTKKQTN